MQNSEGTDIILKFNAQGQLHCDSGPAVVHEDGYEAWYLNGLRHRQGGPAINNPHNGYTAWYENGILVQEQKK